MFSTDKSFRIHRTYTVCQRKSRLFPCCNNLHYIHHPVNQVRIITSENKYPEITFIISSTSIPIPSFPINQTPAPSHLQKSCQIHFPVGGRLNDRYPFSLQQAPHIQQRLTKGPHCHDKKCHHRYKRQYPRPSHYGQSQTPCLLAFSGI